MTLKDILLGFLCILLMNSWANTKDKPPDGIGTPKEDLEADLDKKEAVLTDGFDFPVGNENGKGKYTSLVDGKEYGSWYIAVKTGEENEFGIHTGEDWNGSGGGNTDLGQPIFSIGRGTVRNAQAYPAPLGKVIQVEHNYLENDSIKKVFAIYAHLKEIYVAAGDTVERREKIGTIGNGGGEVLSAHLHLEIRKQSLMDFPVLFWPSLEGKDISWVLENYEQPSKFINSKRKLATLPDTK